ncbi:reverse transcriptase N-terminal domain-containing protein [Streptomyces sp. NPDC006641]|uniref:reverse transcriptase N-terminal domain-containing protein n=1 Tax=unclassified Streptomyces TaxID=2593676 RepID=UPI0036B5D629
MAASRRDRGSGSSAAWAGPSARTVSARKANGTDWAQSEDDVRRRRQRTFEATRAGDLKKVRNPQKLMLRSRSSTLVGVKRVSGGRETAGIGGDVLLDADLAAAFDRTARDHLPASVGQFPARDLIRGWQKAGVVDRAGSHRPGRGLLRAV